MEKHAALAFLEKALCGNKVLEGDTHQRSTVALQLKLLLLWKEWHAIMGSTIAGLVLPLATKNTTLILGGEDPAAVQEAYFYKEEILQRIADYLGEAYFTDIFFKQQLGVSPLTQEVNDNILLEDAEFTACCVKKE